MIILDLSSASARRGGVLDLLDPRRRRRGVPRRGFSSSSCARRASAVGQRGRSSRGAPLADAAWFAAFARRRLGRPNSRARQLLLRGAPSPRSFWAQARRLPCFFESRRLSRAAILSAGPAFPDRACRARAARASTAGAPAFLRQLLGVQRRLPAQRIGLAAGRPRSGAASPARLCGQRRPARSDRPRKESATQEQRQQHRQARWPGGITRDLPATTHDPALGDHANRRRQSAAPAWASRRRFWKS